MIPQNSKKTEYEKVDTNDFIQGVIEEVQYDIEHTFKGFQGAPDQVMQGVRFKFKLDGYQFPKYTKWMKLFWNEKSNLFKFVSQLTDSKERFDLDVLNGIHVKTLWTTKGDFQNLDKIRPMKKLEFLNDAPVIDIEDFKKKHSGLTPDELEPDSNVPF